MPVGMYLADLRPKGAALACAVFAVIAAPAQAWQFSPTPICTLSATEAATQTIITYDGATYTLRLTHPQGWPVGPDAGVFSIAFAPNGPVISTSRHRVSGTTLSVSDSGFGNVLAGLSLNQTAIASVANVTRRIDLTGAAGPTEAFRQCRPAKPAV